MRRIPKRGETIWLGREGDVPWGEVQDPFELEEWDVGDYPEETGNVVEWLREEGLPWFRREDAAMVAKRLGLWDQHMPQKKRREVGSMYQALEILEVYDYIRSILADGRWRRYMVNPRLLEVDAEARLDLRRRTFNHDQKRELWFIAGGRCCICRVRLGPDWHADHVAPWSKGGLTEVANGQALCVTCNHRKHAKTG